jgi:hypothetical protein
MTDITKCGGSRDGEDCPLKDKCWRYNAPAGVWQSYMTPPFEGEECEYFYERNK